MISLEKFRDQKVAVLGLGPGGCALVRNLQASGAKVFAWDANALRREESGTECRPPRQWPIKQMAAVILADGGRGGLSGGVVDRAIAAKVPVYTELEFFGAALAETGLRDEVKIIAVTGAAGKSVTVSIITHILMDQGYDVSVGGGIGEPLFELAAPTPNRVYVLEVPIRRLIGLRELAIDISVTLNVPAKRQSGEIPLAVKALMQVYRTQRPDDTAIIGVDDAIGQELCGVLRTETKGGAHVGTVVPVSGEAALSNGLFVLDGTAYSIRRHKSETLGDFSRAPGFLGAHFNLDAAAAIAACLSVGISSTMVIKALHSYEGLPGRFECLGAAGRVVFVDDSFASSSAAAERAIQACPNVFWIGKNKETHQAVLNSEVVEGELNAAYLMQDELEGSLQEAFEAAYRDAEAFAMNDPEAAPVVLFAPGVPATAGGFQPDDFRELAFSYMSEDVAHA